jgi:CRISPR-associated protein Csd2
MSDQLWEKIKDKAYCDPLKRMDFVLFFDVRDGNPNGDPDAGNLPRMDPQTRQGIVTDVCIKRKIRDYLATVLGRSIYIQSQNALNKLYFDAAREIQGYRADTDAQSGSEDKRRKAAEAESLKALMVELKPESDDGFKSLIATPDDAQQPVPDSDSAGQPSFRDWLVDADVDGLDFDSETNTLTFLGEAKSEKEFKELLAGSEEKPEFDSQIAALAKLLAKAKKHKTGRANERNAREAVKTRMCTLYDDIHLFGGVLTAGTNAGQIRGPLQLTFARSIEPILQQDAAITRCAITRAADFKKKQTEFGRKPWLNWAVYRQHGFFNPLLGQQTGVKRENLAMFWEALACMFRNSDAASKGEMTMHDIIVFVHDHPRGNAPSHLLFEKVTWRSEENKENNAHAETAGTTVIKRDGFGNRYAISVEQPSNGKITVERPLRDLWAA